MQPIFHAILNNDLPAFLGLVEERESSLEDVNEEEHMNSTILHIAARLGHREFVSKILELRPSLVCSRDAYGNTPLHLAALLGDVNIVMQMLEIGLEVCSVRNDNNQTPFHLACSGLSMEAPRLIAEKTQSISLDELHFSISRGSTGIAGIILQRFPDLAREESWVVEGGSQSTLLHYACDRGDSELTSVLLGLDQGLEKARNTNGLSPLHLAVLRGPVVILEEFLNKVPLSFKSLTMPLKETVFHLAARNKHMDAFVFMAESSDINSRDLLQQTDEDGNTVLHIAASVACDAPFIRYIVGKKIVDITYKNKMGFEAFQLLPREAQDFELLTRWLRFGTETSADVDSEINEEHDSHSNPVDKQSQGLLEPVDICTSSRDGEVIIHLLRLIEINTSEIAERKKRKKHGIRVNTSNISERKKRKEHDGGRGRESLEYDMHIEELQNSRNTIAIVAVLIASVAYAGGINPPGGVYQDGPSRGKSLVGKTTAFKVFALCNYIALFTSLCIVILLISIIPYKRKPLKKLLVATHRMMWVSVGFVATAYIAASWVTIPHYLGTQWLFPAIISVAGGALAVLFSYLLVKSIGHRFRKMNFLGDLPSFAKTSSDLAVSMKSGYFTCA